MGGTTNIAKKETLPYWWNSKEPNVSESSVFKKIFTWLKNKTDKYLTYFILEVKISEADLAIPKISSFLINQGRRIGNGAQHAKFISRNWLVLK